jgi:HEAT repeat protein
VKNLLSYFIFACLLLACAKGVLLKQSDEDAVNAAAKLYESSGWDRRLRAVEQLAGIRSGKAVDLLIRATGDVHPLVRIEAINGLAKSDAARARRTVKNIAEYETNSNVRWYALKALSGFRDPTAAPAFANGLRSDDMLIREESIRGLLMIDDFAIKYISIPYILQALEDPVMNVRLAALDTLSIRDERIYKMLTDMLDREVFYKYTVLKAVLRALYGYALDPLTRKIVTGYLVHPNVDVRLLSLRVLKKDRELQKIAE